MSKQIFLEKGSSRNMMTNVSTKQARKLSRAMKALRKTPINDLEREGYVKRLNVSCRNDVYTYRVCPSIRMVFSPVGENYVIHDILFFAKDSSVKSLLDKVQ